MTSKWRFLEWTCLASSEEPEEWSNSRHISMNIFSWKNVPGGVTQPVREESLILYQALSLFTVQTFNKGYDNGTHSRRSSEWMVHTLSRGLMTHFLKQLTLKHTKTEHKEHLKSHNLPLPIMCGCAWQEYKTTDCFLHIHPFKETRKGF